MVSFFHSYDLRGTYPDEIGSEEARKVGKAYGTFTDAEEVLVGRDGRTHAEEVTEAFIKGILSTGTDVAYAGMAPSPVVYYGQVQSNFGSAAVVTASHNPSEYTGFKFNLEDALAMSREGGMKQIQKLYEEENFDKGEGSQKSIDLIEDYISTIESEIGLLNQKVSINCGNGVTGVIARKMFERLNCSVEMVNEEVDGSFPNHLADPGNKEAQKALRKEMSEDSIGILFDGDGDRAGFILSDYGYVGEDELLALYSKYILNTEKTGKIVYDLRASKLVPEQIRNAGGEPVESRVGHTFISEQIHEDNDIVFAGELSGHLYFPVYGFPWDDGLFAAALLLKIASEKKLSDELDNFEEYPVSPEMRIDCPHKAKSGVIKSVKEHYSDFNLTTKDGVKISFVNGWALVRPSNTEPKMSVRCEADTREDLEKITSDVEERVREFIEESS